MNERPIVVVSNRGPTTFSIVDGAPVAGPPAGGLARGLRPLVAATNGSWLACAVSDADRLAAASPDLDPGDVDVGFLVVDGDTYRHFYDVISNGTLWFVHHNLWDLPNWPSFDDEWHRAWTDYVAVNHAMAALVVEQAPPDALVLVQDYHFALVASAVREARPDVRLTHFSHTPFSGPESLLVLPTAAHRALVEGLAAHDACGFHTERWAAHFRENCSALGIDAPRTFVSPLPPDTEGIAGLASSPECDERLDTLTSRIGDRALLLSSGRLELSKNLVRAIEAFELLLDRRPDLHDRCVFAAFVYATREGLPEYQQYRRACLDAAARVNERRGTDTWQPVILDTGDDLPRSIAGLRRYDALIINPIRDGLNLVAFEGPTVNERNGVLVLSTEAGAHEQLQDMALSCHPYDLRDLADQMERALDMDDEERGRRAHGLADIAASRDIRAWLDDHIAALS